MGINLTVTIILCLLLKKYSSNQCYRFMAKQFAENSFKSLGKGGVCMIKCCMNTNNQNYTKMEVPRLN